MVRSHDAPNTMRGRLSPARLSAARVGRRGFQIGPKIRIGGTVGKIGQSVKEGVGKVAKVAALPVSFFNPAIGAALAAGGKALDTTDGGSSLGDLALAGAKTYGMGKVAGPLVRAIPGMGSIGDKLGGLAKALPGVGSIMGSGGGMTGAPSSSGIPGDGVYIPGGAGDVGQLPVGTPSGGGMPWEQILSAATGGGTQGGSGGIDWGSILGNVGGFVKDNGLDLAMAGLATAQGVNAAKASQRAGGFQDKAINLAEQNWAAGAPLRAAGTTRLLTPKATNLSAVYTDPANPFARVRRMA
jgi:predicted phage tail protein